MSIERLPEDQPNKVIKEYVEKDGPEDWQHKDTLKFLYHAFDLMRFTFLSPRDDTQLPIPQAVLGIAKEDVRILAFFRMTYNPNGLPLEIVLNEAHIRRPRWELAESLAHEMLHLYQEWMVKKRQHDYFSCAGNHHNLQFCALAKEIGLNVFPGAGYHFAPPDQDSQFERALRLIGEERPNEAAVSDGAKLPPVKPDGNYWDKGPKPKGTSTLMKLIADECTKSPICILRAGRKGMNISCDDCRGRFHPVI